ncbi:MAG: dihydroxy-acid dehydratase [Desulfobacteraceae bacterium]|nr:dihydroxy-acid dehydratase [Desulfobacteraceae bacterium]
MKKPKSRVLVDDSDFPINIVRRNMLRGTGSDIEDLRNKPVIAIVNSQTDFNPGHMHLRFLAEKAREGVWAAGGVPFEFNVPAPCDGMTEGHEGMRFILPQRELIADMVETHVRSMMFDGMVMIASCDKIIPGMIMAAARLDLATIFITGGPGMWEKRLTGRPKDNKTACCGACDIMGTANTFQCMAEALGLTLPGTANIPGFHTHKLLYARQAGKRIVEMVEEDLTARKILTEKAVENAVILDLAIGGSTNATLHLPAIAHELGFSLPLSRFNDLNRKIPTLLSIDPNGDHSVVDLYAAGGMPAVMKTLAGDLHLEALCVDGRTLKDMVEEAQVLNEAVIRPKDKPYMTEGGTVILFGNLAPDGAVVKQSAVSKDMLVFTGKARVFDSEAFALKAFRTKDIKEGQIIIIRYEGPKGGPGMPETLAITMAIKASGLKKVALVTDGRFSGASAGPCIGHVSPEAYAGGPIAAVCDGDEIDIDIPGRSLNVKLSQEEISDRLKNFKPLEPDIPKGYMKRYVKMVTSAAKGAVLE